MNTEVYVVVIDQHTEPEVELFLDRDAAIARARDIAIWRCDDPSDIHEQVCAGSACEFFLYYSEGGYNVTVMKREVK